MRNVPTPSSLAPAELPSRSRSERTISPLVHAVACVLLVGGTCALYQGATELGFFDLDDPTYVLQNPHVQGVTAANLSFVLTEPYFANYSPVHLISYMADHAIGGLDPRTFHISNHLWAGLVACGVYLLAWVLLQRLWIALAVATAFVVHPAHVEAVAWISSRKDLVAAAFALPALAFYLLYRRGGYPRKAFYAISVMLFVLAIAGKLSVVVLPGILLVFDWFGERRGDKGILFDKVPYVVVAALFSLRVMGVQPDTREVFDFFVFGHSTLSNLWLLSGCGDYVLMRPRPEAAEYGAVGHAIAAAPFVLVATPLLLRKWLPGVAVALCYFVLFALVPSQVLSFIHPVADRYLFFPSVGFVLLLGWAAKAVAERFDPPRMHAPLVAMLFLTVFWGQATLGYLGEWRDPRSVWLAASRKVDEITVYQYLGSHFQDAADEVAVLAKDPTRRERATRLAQAVWEGDPRLEPLLEEWQSGATGERSAAYATCLQGLAEAEYEKALATGSTRVVPNLYFRLAKLATDRGDLERAKTLFQRAYDESTKHTSRDVREQLSVMCQHALGLVYWRERNYTEALKWVRGAETAQRQFGGHWLPQVSEHRARLERLTGQKE